MVKNNIIVDTRYFLIKPPYLHFNKQNIKIHNITEDDVRNSPKFPVIWENIKPFFEQNIVIAHNAYFDMSVLMLNLDYYNIQIPDFKYADSMYITTKACGYKTPKGLVARADFFKLDFQNHHNALADAMMCAQIVIETIKSCDELNFSSFLKTYDDIYIKNFKDVKPKKFFEKGNQQLQ